MKGQGVWVWCVFATGAGAFLMVNAVVSISRGWLTTGKRSRKIHWRDDPWNFIAGIILQMLFGGGFFCAGIIVFGHNYLGW
jgi:hypothetical protein